MLGGSEVPVLAWDLLAMEAYNSATFVRFAGK
jgi:hypothetical protein